jgi:predicted RNA-binding Zn-ribbon protein involved in translation (DUF1610 family)
MATKNDPQNRQSDKAKKALCPKCAKVMVATYVANKPKGMYWICPECNHRIKI